MIDTGATNSYISEENAKEGKILDLKKPIILNTIHGKSKIFRYVKLNIFSHDLMFFVVDSLGTFDMLLGFDSLRKMNAIVDSMSLKLIYTIKNKIQFVNYSLQNNVSEEIKSRIHHLIEENNNTPILPFNTKVRATIRTMNDTPIWTKSYAYPRTCNSFVDGEIERLLKNGIIRVSHSPYNSPLWVVPKKGFNEDGSPKQRLVIDFSKLNSFTIFDRYPMPDVKVILSNLGDAKFFSKIDLESGYHQILIQECDIERSIHIVHIDFYDFEQNKFLIFVDSYSKWLEVIKMGSTVASATIDKLRMIFSVFGLPTEIVSDNGPPFSSIEFKDFCKRNAIKLTFSPPRRAQSNGEGEVAVRDAKQALKKMLIDERTKKVPILSKVTNFLLKHRLTPTTVTGNSPASMIFNFKPKSLLDVLNDRPIARRNDPPVYTQKKQETHEIKNQIIKKVETYEINEIVSYQIVWNNFVKWVPAKVIQKISNSVYTVLVNGTSKNAHLRQLRKTKASNLDDWPGTFEHTNLESSCDNNSNVNVDNVDTNVVENVTRVNRNV